AGVLLGAAFVHMIPQAGEIAGPSTSSLALMGMLVLLLIEKFVMVHACPGDACDYHTIGLTAFVGLSLHSILEGVAIASSATMPALGPVVVVAIIAHKVPASLSLSGLLLAAGYRRGQILGLLALFSLMVPVGAIGAYSIIGSVSEYVVSALIAVSAGTFIYIAASDLLPELHRAHQFRTLSLATFLGGIALTWGASALGA
ncbi:MAG: ZIP family metal transporter, partial [Armatimonadota bacterium]